MPRLASSIALIVVAAVPATAQSSQFGIRGLGLPGREASTRTLGLGGASGLFDGESSINPAGLAGLTTVTALFTTSGEWRSSTNPSGTASTRATRFPQVLIGGPIPRTPLSIGVSYSLYTDRDFTVVSDGVASPRGVPITVHDTLASRGGIDDLRLGGALVITPHLAVGAAMHFFTGSNRLASRRQWDDTTYLSPQELAELSYRGLGFSAGVIWQPARRLEVAGMVRHDGTVTVRRDSNGTGQVRLPTLTVGKVGLPTTLSAGLQYTPSARLSLSASVISRNWSVADSSLVAQGAPGARNTTEVNAGAEIFRDVRHPLTFPIRVGVRRTTLPFLLAAEPQPSEFGLSLGTGRRFAKDRGGFDVAVEHVWRSQGSGYKESATMITIGVSVRPGGLVP